jgi:hypothetical protein
VSFDSLRSLLRSCLQQSISLWSVVVNSAKFRINRACIFCLPRGRRRTPLHLGRPTTLGHAPTRQPLAGGFSASTHTAGWACPVVSCRVVSCRVVSCRVVSCRVLSCPVVSCRVLSCPVLSCPVLSCPVVSCRVLSCPVLSCPVRSFKPNPYSLYNMIGNVWAWCSDWYRNDTCKIQASSGEIIVNPHLVAKRGGSFLCDAAYCASYRAASRMKTSPNSGLLHQGFRAMMSDEA